MKGDLGLEDWPEGLAQALASLIQDTSEGPTDWDTERVSKALFQTNVTTAESDTKQTEHGADRRYSNVTRAQNDADRRDCDDEREAWMGYCRRQQSGCQDSGEQGDG